MNRIRKEPGGCVSFTLLELLVVICIASALIAGAMFFTGAYISWSQQTADKQTYTILNDALNRYKTQGGGIAGLTYDATISRVLADMQSQVVWAGMPHQFLESGVTYHGKSIGETGTGSLYHFSRYNSFNDGSGDGSSGNGGGGGPGNIYVSDQTNHCVAEYNSSGSYVGSFGASYLSGPRGMACDSSGNVYVSDQTNKCVIKFSGSGTYLSTIGSSATLTSPRNCLLDGSGNLYVSDTGLNAVVIFNSAGAYVTSYSAYSVFGACFAGGNLLVSDQIDHRINVLSGGVYQGNFGASYLNDPVGIATDGGGNIYVADSSRTSVYVFTGGEAYSTAWGSSSNISSPRNLAFDSSGNLYVANNSSSKGISKFNSQGVFQTSFTNAAVGALIGIAIH